MRQRIRDKILNATTALGGLAHVARTRHLTESEYEALRLKLKEIEDAVNFSVTWGDAWTCCRGIFMKRDRMGIK